MTEHPERRRRRRCPSCGGSNFMRGPKVPGLAIPLAHANETTAPSTATPYVDICYDCGMVCLFIRLSEAVRPSP